MTPLDPPASVKPKFTAGDVRSLNNRELLDFMQSDHPLEKARAAFSAAYGRIEQAGMQRRKPDIFEIRKMEIEAAQSVIAAYAAIPKREASSHERDEARGETLGGVQLTGSIWIRCVNASDVAPKP